MTRDAIYFYNYMAMSMQNPTAYLDSLLNYIWDNLKTLVPTTLGLDISANETTLEDFAELVKQIKESQEVEYLELVIEQGYLSTSCNEKRYFCFLLFLLLLSKQSSLSDELMKCIGSVLDRTARSCDGEIISTDKNINILVFFEVGFRLHQSNKKFTESAAKRLLAGTRTTPPTSYLAKGIGFKK